jgi:hypothetical protein
MPEAIMKLIRTKTTRARRRNEAIHTERTSREDSRKELNGRQVRTRPKNKNKRNAAHHLLVCYVQAGK